MCIKHNMHHVFTWSQGNSVVNIHGFLISCCSTFSPWARAPSALFEGIQPVSKWNITDVPPPHLRQIIFHIPPRPQPTHPRVSLKYKNRQVRQCRQLVPLRLTPVSVRLPLHPSVYHLLFDELPDDPGHLVSVHLHHRLGHFDAFVGICRSYIQESSIKGSLSFTVFFF